MIRPCIGITGKSVLERNSVKYDIKTSKISLKLITIQEKKGQTINHKKVQKKCKDLKGKQRGIGSDQN